MPRYFRPEHAAIDPAGRRLFSDALGRGLLVWDLDTLEPLETIEIPLPEPPPERLAMFDPEPTSWRFPAPVFDPVSGRLLVFRDRRVFVVDSRKLAVERLVDRAVGSADGAILGAEMDATSRRLYLWAHDSQIQSAMVGTRLVGLDLDSWKPVFETEAQGELLAVLAWEGRLAAVDFMYKRFGIHLRLWENGQLRQHLVDGPDIDDSRGLDGDVGLAIDSRRNRLLMSDSDKLWIMDPATLELRDVIPKPWPGRLIGFEPGDEMLRFVESVTQRQHRWPVSEIRTAEVDGTPDRIVEPEQVYVYRTHAPGGAGSPEVFAPGFSHRCVLYSPDLGATWTCLGARLPASAKGPEIHTIAVLPRAGGEPTLLAAVGGYGLYRSEDMGRRWQPANRGLTSLSVVSLIASPQAEQDGLVFARSQHGKLFRSSDWGRSWAEVGAFRLPTFDPKLVTTQRLFSFEQGTGQLVRSDDAGRSWTRLGALPDSGFEGLELAIHHEPGANETPVMLAHAASGFFMLSETEPSMDHRIYRSVDGGLTWLLTLDALEADRRDHAHAQWSADIGWAGWQGPLETSSGAVFVVELEHWPRNKAPAMDPLFITRDAGLTWQGAEYDPEVARHHRIVAVADDGKLLTTTEDPGRLSWTTTDAWLKTRGFVSP